ncbi:MAG: tetratricopeptide repeat protein [Nitrospiraceae bacterium]|jgi:lipopolysaccharide biosynthesis regulator YciM|nr:tetratricopeptide repeat protein [Nitrospiraceae bacterium]
MGKTTTTLMLVFLGVLGALAFDNREMVTLKIPFGETYEMSKVTLILFSTILGAFVVLIGFFIRDTKRAIDGLQEQKRSKREAKIQAAYAKALNAILGHKDEEANEALNDILKDDPEHVDALVRLGDIALGHDDTAAAMDYYRRAYAINAKSLPALLGLVAAHERIHNWQGALRHIDEILDIDAANLTALYKKQAVLERLEKWDDLLSLQKTILKLEVHEKEKQREERKVLGYKYEYARVSLENAELEKAEKAFRTILRMNASFLPAYLGLAEILVTRGETEEAINFLEKSFESLNAPILLARLEDLLISVGEPGRLIRYYLSAIAQRPTDRELKFLLGKLYARLEMVDDALQVLSSLDSTSLPGAELYRLRGELYLKRNQSLRALDEFRAALAAGRLETPAAYCCSSCSAHGLEWAGRCPECGEWNTYTLDIYGSCPR